MLLLRLSNPPFGSKGFTLLEVLVALAIVGISLAALFTALIQSTRLSSRVEERMVGSWVASNHMTEARARSTWPEPGEERVDVQMADRSWYISQEVLPTEDKNIRRVNIVVALDKKGENQVANLYGYFFKPGPRLTDR